MPCDCIELQWRRSRLAPAYSLTVETGCVCRHDGAVTGIRTVSQSWMSETAVRWLCGVNTSRLLEAILRRALLPPRNHLILHYFKCSSHTGNNVLFLFMSPDAILGEKHPAHSLTIDSLNLFSLHYLLLQNDFS